MLADHVPPDLIRYQTLSPPHTLHSSRAQYGECAFIVKLEIIPTIVFQLLGAGIIQYVVATMYDVISCTTKREWQHAGNVFKIVSSLKCSQF